MNKCIGIIAEGDIDKRAQESWNKFLTIHASRIKKFYSANGRRHHLQIE